MAYRFASAHPLVSTALEVVPHRLKRTHELLERVVRETDVLAHLFTRQRPDGIRYRRTELEMDRAEKVSELERHVRWTHPKTQIELNTGTRNQYPTPALRKREMDHIWNEETSP
jgi:hypothetical protein